MNPSSENWKNPENILQKVWSELKIMKMVDNDEILINMIFLKQKKLLFTLNQF